MYGCHVRKPNKAEFDDIKHHIDKSYYELCVYKYPQEYTIIVLKYFEIKEMFEECQKIKNVLEKESLKTNLQPCI